MIINKNNFNRFEIESIQDPGFEKNGIHVSGINGYHGPLKNILGLILEIFHIAISVKTDKGTYYFNCNSLRNWFKRVMPAPKNYNDFDIKLLEKNGMLEPLIHRRDWVQQAIDDLAAKKTPKVPDTAQLPIVKAAKSFKDQLVTTLRLAKPLEQMDSIKVFLNIESGEKKFKKDFIIKKTEENELNGDVLSKKTDEILNEAIESLGAQGAQKNIFEWEALIKDKNGIFHNGHGCKSDWGTGNDIDIEEYCKIICEHMGRELKPQLNENKDFI